MTELEGRTKVADMVCLSAPYTLCTNNGTNSTSCGFQTYRTSENDGLEGGSEGGELFHLIVEYEQTVVRCQSDRAGQQILAQGLVPKTDYGVATEHTFAVVLTTKRTDRSLSLPQQPGGTSNTYRFEAPCSNVPLASALSRFCKPWPGPFTVRGAEKGG